MIAVFIFVGMVAIVRAKYVSWRTYRDYFESTGRPLPEPFASEPLKWGVDARYTAGALAPDLALLLVFVAAWCAVLLQ